MPVNYNFPPWIGGAGSALGAVQAGASLGARIAEANQRAALSYAELQAQQQRFAIEQQYKERQFEARQQLNAEQELRKEQQLEMENARKDAELGLKRQAVELDAKTQAAKFAAQTQFLKETQAYETAQLAKGVDEQTARRNAVQMGIAKYGPAMGVPGTVYGNLFKETPPQKPIKMRMGDQLVEMTKDGPRAVFKVPPKESSTESKMAMGDYGAARSALYKATTDAANAGKEIDPALKADLLRKMNMARWQLSGQTQSQTPAVPGINAPAPNINTPKPVSQTNAPAPGSTIGGYTFKGGDPSQQSNWEPVSSAPAEPTSDETEE